MMQEALKQFADNLHCDEPMSKHTTWKIGGTADYYFTPENRQQLQQFLSLIPNELPVLWIGLGSNVLFPDEGYRGVVINSYNCLNDISFDAEQQGQVAAEVGVSCAKFARETVRRGFIGSEFFNGIPGTLGGALAMNAGAFGGDTWSAVKHLETIDRKGRIKQREPSEFEIAYRSVKGLQQSNKLPSEWFLSVTFLYTVDIKQAEQLKQTTRNLLLKRNASQPVNTANAGSIFKNPQGNYAAKLIEQCGLKKYAIGGAMISEKHANFIINQGNACAVDVRALIHHIQQVVKQQTGYQLECEVKLIEN